MEIIMNLSKLFEKIITGAKNLENSDIGAT